MWLNEREIDALMEYISCVYSASEEKDRADQGLQLAAVLDFLLVSRTTPGQK